MSDTTDALDRHVACIDAALHKLELADGWERREAINSLFALRQMVYDLRLRLRDEHGLA